jgi:aromatic-L-amino-acid decarboxylase
MSGPEDRSLELSGPALRDLIEAASKRILAHIESLPRQPAADTAGGAELARSLETPLPEAGRPAEELLELLFARVIPKSFNTAGPGYLAYIPGGGLPSPPSRTSSRRRRTGTSGVFAAAPGLAAIEANVVRWFCGMVGLPPDAGGILTSGGSLSNFSALLAARREKLPEDFLSGTLYASDQAHHSIAKAAMLAGFPERQVRSVESDERFRIRPEALERAIARDRADGLRPFFLVGNAGTTNTGAVDDLTALAGIARREGLWFHVDAAYGGFFVLTERGRRALAGIELADSIALDPHKGLFLPYGTGSLLVRDVEALKRAHALSGEYMPEMQEDPDFPDFNLLSPELSRGWRGPARLAARRDARDRALPREPRGKARPRELGRGRAFEDSGGRDPGRAAALDRGVPRGTPRPVGGGAVGVEPHVLARVNARARVHLTGTMLRIVSRSGSASSRSARTGTGWNWPSRTSGRRSRSRAISEVI